MHKIRRIKGSATAIIVTSAMVILAVGAHGPMGEAATTEARGVWIHPESMFSGDAQVGRKQVREFIDKIAAANFNFVLPWTRSDYLVALKDTEYQKAVPIARWDAVGEIIKVATEKGLQAHLWYSFTHYKSGTSPEFDPRLGGNPEWAARRIDEIIPDRTTGRPSPRRMDSVSPAIPEARAWQLNLISAALQRYSYLKGLHIEEPGYGTSGYDANAKFLELFRETYKAEPTHNIDGPDSTELKARLTTQFMRNLRNILTERYPAITLSANGGFSWQADRRLGRDWMSWARMGWLGYYSPQIYQSNLDAFRTRAETVLRDLGPICPVYIGIGLAWSGGGSNTKETALKQIDIARQAGAKGVIFFSGKSLTEDYFAALREGPFREAAVMPMLVKP